jgi:hypothetical protein
MNLIAPKAPGIDNGPTPTPLLASVQERVKALGALNGSNMKTRTCQPSLMPAHELVKKLPDWLAEIEPDLPEQRSTTARKPHRPLIPAQAGIQFFQIDTSVLGKLVARVRGHERRLAGSGSELRGKLTLTDFFTASCAGMSGCWVSVLSPDARGILDFFTRSQAVIQILKGSRVTTWVPACAGTSGLGGMARSAVGGAVSRG